MEDAGKTHLLGVKVSVPFWATTTVILAAEAQATRPKRVETAAAKRISQIDLKEGNTTEIGETLEAQVR